MLLHKQVAALKSTNIKRWWSEIKSLQGGRVSSPWHLQLLSDLCPSVEHLVEQFNQFLGSLTESFTPLPPPVPGLFFPTPSEFLIDDVTAFKALCAVKTNKSSGPDPFPCRIWKDFAVELAPVVRDIYNASLVQGFIPSQLKQSIISPLPKCSPPKDIKADLRPIALTSQFSKVLEGFTCRFLYDHVVDLIDDKQFALAGKSTTHALVYFLHVILEGLDRGDMYARVLFTDFSKGFDLVDHHALLHELEILGVHDCLIRWIKAFLCHRQQRVKIDGILSPPISPRGGIPQGTRLAPLLFAVLVNRLAEDWSTRLKYVDDATVIELIPRNSPSYLPIVASDINKFSSHRNMRLNAKKCKEMVFDFLQYKSTTLSPLMIGGAVIDRVQSYKLLGLHISNDLTWNSHCETVYKKAVKRLYGLRVLKKAGMSTGDLVSVYCSIVRSTVEYASPAWAALPQYLSNMLESVQKQAMRVIFPGFLYEDALDLAGLDPLYVRRIDSCKSFVIKAKEVLRVFYSPTVVEHDRNLRSGNKTIYPNLGRTARLNNFVTVKYQ